MKKIAIILILVLAATSSFAASGSLFPEWGFDQGMKFLAGFSCTVGLGVYGTILAVDLIEGYIDPLEIAGLTVLNGFFLFVAYFEYMDLFTADGQFRYLHWKYHKHEMIYATAIKIQGFTIGYIY